MIFFSKDYNMFTLPKLQILKISKYPND